MKHWTLILFIIPFFRMNAQVDYSKLPISSKAPAIEMKKPFTFSLKNGIEVYFIPDSISGMVQLSYYHDLEPYFEGEKAGVSDLMSRMLGRGTTSISSKEFQKKTEQYAVSVNFNSHGAGLSALQKNFDRALPLFADALMNPLWDEAFFKKEKERMIQSINANEFNAEYIADRLGDYLLFKDHPYGEMVSVESLRNIKLNDVKSLYNQNFATKNSYLLIRGDFAKDEIKSLVEKQFSDWNNIPKTSSKELKKVEKAKETTIVLVDVPNAVQTQLSISYPIQFTKNNPKYIALSLANSIFGGSFNSRLNMNLREKNSFTYGASGGIKSDKYQAYFEASAKVKTEVTDSALVEMIIELKSLKSKPISTEELTLAKASLKGRFIRQFEDVSFPLQSEINIILDELPKDFYATYLTKVEEKTEADVNNAMKEFFELEGSLILIVGDAKNIKPNLLKFGFPIFTYDRNGKPIAKDEL